MIVQRLFTLESGSYSGSRRTPRSSGQGVPGGAIIGGLLGAALGGAFGHESGNGASGAIIGGLAGAGLGAVTTWLSNISDQSSFNSNTTDKYNSWDFLNSLDLYFNQSAQDSEVTTSETESEEENGRTSSRTVTRKSIIRPKRDAEGIRYNIDGDPRKHVISILFSGSAALYINKPTQKEIAIIDNVLDSYCRKFKRADYIAEKVGKDSYFVDLKLIENYEDWVGIEFIERGIKLNVITGQRFGIKKYSKINQREFATVGEALEKKANKLMEHYNISKAQALELIKKRDLIATKLNEKRNLINKTYDLTKYDPNSFDRNVTKAKRNLGYIDAIADANLESLASLDHSYKNHTSLTKKAIDRHALRDSSGKDLLIKAKYAKRNAKNWIKKNPGKTALGVGTAAGLAYGGKKLYDHYNKKEENENN